VTDAAQPAVIAMSAAAQPSKRLLSLDAFRGLTILGMLLVNNAALDVATPSQLTHAEWNQGVHFADMVFPWFLLIVGVAIPYSAASRRAKGVSSARYGLRVLRRTVGLFLLGCLIDSSLAKRPVLGLGVLQLIALAYAAGALAYGLPWKYRLACAGVLLIGHWAAIRFVPVPGAGAGIFTEHTNLVNHLNEVYLEPLGLRGLVSVVPTSALVLIGTALGDLLRRPTHSRTRTGAYLSASGIALAVVGWLWNLDLPFNKPVWTASYILYAAGWGTTVLGLCYLLIDVRGWSRWAFPLVVPGSNAIFAYVAPILVKVHLLQEWAWTAADGSPVSLQESFLGFFVGHAGRIAGGWLYTFSYIGLWWLVLLAMYRRRVFLRL
jgi:predicted acyltransferase